MDESALKALDRKALQKLAKTNGIKANLKSNEIIKQLLASLPSKRSSPVRRPAAAPARRRAATPHQPQPNDAEPSPPREDEEDSVPVFPPAPSSRARGTRRPATRAQPPRSKSRPAQAHGGRSASSKAPRTHAPPHQSPSSSPPPEASQGRLPSFDQHLSAVCQAEAGPSQAKGKAPTLGVFNESSASRAPWPQEHQRPRSLTPSSHPAGPSQTRSTHSTHTHATRPAPVAGPSTSASASRHGPIVPEPGYRSRSPTPLEEYDSMRGVPLFPEPASDYEESWTPYSSPDQPSQGGNLQAPAGSGAQPGGPSPVFPLSRAVFSPAEPAPEPAPPRSPVFRAPSTPRRRRPTNPVGRDNHPEVHGEDEDGAAHDGGDELEDYEDGEVEEEEDEAHKLATDEQLHRMVVRLATVARHQAAMQPGIDNIVEAVNGVQAAAPRLRAQVRQERASFERMRAFLAHVNTRVAPAWDHAAIWDTACVLREDGNGNEVEIETSDEEEAQWRRDNPRPPKALPTKIEMRRVTPWFPGVCEDEDRDNVRDIGEAIEKCRAEWKEVDAIRAREAAAQVDAPAPSTPKRRRGGDDDDEEAEEDGGRAKKKVRGSAGRTPAPSAFFKKGQKGDGADAKNPILVGIAEEDSGEEEVDMVMTSVV